jgi:hypothetical protein
MVMVPAIQQLLQQAAAQQQKQEQEANAAQLQRHSSFNPFLGLFRSPAAPVKDTSLIIEWALHRLINLQVGHKAANPIT